MIVNKQKFTTFDIQELREMLGVPESYKTKDFRYLMERAKKEISDKTNLSFNFKLQKVGSRSANKINIVVSRQKSK